MLEICLKIKEALFRLKMNVFWGDGGLRSVVAAKFRIAFDYALFLAIIP